MLVGKYGLVSIISMLIPFWHCNQFHDVTSIVPKGEMVAKNTFKSNYQSVGVRILGRHKYSICGVLLDLVRKEGNCTQATSVLDNWNNYLWVNRCPVKSPLKRIRSDFFFSKNEFLGVTVSPKRFGSSLYHLAAIFYSQKTQNCDKVRRAKTRKNG